MEQNLKIDTADYLDKNDYSQMDKIIKVKKNIMSFINNDALINMIKSIIEGSSIIDFPNERSKRINPNRLSFTICYDMEKIMSKQEELKFENREHEVNFLTNIIFDELISPFSKFIIQSIQESDEIKDFLKENKIFTVDDEEKNDLQMQSMGDIISTIFGLRFDLERKLANVEYLK